MQQASLCLTGSRTDSLWEGSEIVWNSLSHKCLHYHKAILDWTIILFMLEILTHCNSAWAKALQAQKDESNFSKRLVVEVN